MKSEKDFEAALRDLKKEISSNMEKLRDLKKMFDEQVKMKRRSRLITGHLNSSSASPARRQKKNRHFCGTVNNLIDTSMSYKCVNLNPTGCMGMQPPESNKLQHPVCCNLLDSAGWVLILPSIDTGARSAPL